MTIRCVLASGREIKGWRRDRKLSGGGIVIDEGYHLFDSAVWLLEAADPGKRFTAKDINVSVNFEYNSSDPELDVEIGAVGTAIIEPLEVLIHFDLSYNVPIDSVFEMLEVRDEVGNRIRLIRNQTKRSSQPGRILHQLRNSTVIHDGFVKKEADDSFTFVSDYPLTTANNIGPLRQFLYHVANFDEQTTVKQLSTRIKGQKGQNECDARVVQNTQELIAAIYLHDKREPLSKNK